MHKALREFTLVHTMNAARRQVAADLWTKPISLNHKSACRPPVNYTHHRHFIITQPESWYSFYHPMEGRRLSWPSWLVTYPDPSANRARRRVTSLIEINALPLSHATMSRLKTFYNDQHGLTYCDPWPMWPDQNCDPLNPWPIDPLHAVFCFC